MGKEPITNRQDLSEVRFSKRFMEALLNHFAQLTECALPGTFSGFQQIKVCIELLKKIEKVTEMAWER